MAAENLLVNDGCDWQTVKTVSERFPKFDIVPALALVVKPIYPIYASALVIASQQEKIFRVFDFVSKKETYRFQ